MEEESAALRVRPGLAEGLVVVGGVAAIVGSFLVWFRVHLGLKGLGVVARTISSKGIDGADGKITLIAGVVAVLMGLLMFLRNSGRSRVARGVVALLGGLTAAGLSGYDAATPQQRFIDANAPELAAKTHISMAQAERLYQGLFNSGALKISLAVGVLVVIAGGAIAALAAAVALGKSPEEVGTVTTPEPTATELGAPPARPSSRPSGHQNG
jgi:hypothetical protein